MRLAIHAIASFWYTAWIDAGQPNLGTLSNKLTPEELHQLEMEKKEYETGSHKPRDEGDH
jgi:hypothetical protein